jgi:hypothetical protein
MGPIESFFLVDIQTFIAMPESTAQRIAASDLVSMLSHISLRDISKVEDRLFCRNSGNHSIYKLSVFSNLIGRGGGCSLERTALRAKFPLTGKNTGNFLRFCLQMAWHIPLFS